MLKIPKNIEDMVASSISIEEIFRKLGVSKSASRVISLRQYIESNGINISHFKLKPKKSIETLKKNLKIAQLAINEQAKKNRKNPEFFIKYMIYDARRQDKKKGFKCDLEEEQIKDLLKLADFRCSYCRANNIKLTLDRKDNKAGHTKENINIGCIRCNYLRGSMPYPGVAYYPDYKKLNQKVCLAIGRQKE